LPPAELIEGGPAKLGNSQFPTQAGPNGRWINAGEDFDGV